MKIENRAINRQIDFLEKCKNNVPFLTHTYLLRVLSWTVDNQPILDGRPIRFSKAQMEQGIEGEIRYYRSILKLRTLTQYQNNRKKKNSEFNRIMMNTLSLYSKNSREQTSYPEMELTL